MFRLPAHTPALLQTCIYPDSHFCLLRAIEILSPRLGVQNISNKWNNSIYRLWLIFFSQHNLPVLYLEKYSSTVKQLAYRGWHHVNRREPVCQVTSRLEEGEEEGHDRGKGLWAIGDERQSSVSLTPDTDGTGSGSYWIQFYLLSWKKRSSSV